MASKHTCLKSGLTCALLLSLSLTACSRTEDTNVVPTEAPTPSISIETNQPAESTAPATEAVSLSPAQFQAVAGSEVLRSYTGAALEGLSYPELTLWGEKLLLWNTNYTEDMESSTMTLRVLDLSTGEVTAEIEIPIAWSISPQICNGQLVLADSGMGTVRFYDETLTMTKEYTLEGDYESWYLSADGASLYHTAEYTKLLKTDLASGNEEAVLENCVNIYGGTTKTGGTNLTLVNGETQMTQELWLDFQTGQVSEPPFSGCFSTVSCENGLWLCWDYKDASVYYFGTDSAPQVLTLESGSIGLTDHGELICADEAGTTLTLYDRTGTFRSSCTLPAGEGAYTAGTYLWSEVCQGYFFVQFDSNGTPSLLFWDNTSAYPGAALNTVSLTSYRQVPGGTAVSQELYQRAESLGETYGIEIRIADQCDTDFEAFSAQPEYDEEVISWGLDVIETALSSYPEGFFQQLKFDRTDTVLMELVGTLTATDENWGTESYSAFTQQDENNYLMVLDLYSTATGTLYHEFSHIIDRKLDWDNYCRDYTALYSENGWESLNPEGFTYQYVYSGYPDWSFQWEQADYFVDTYAMVSGTEDRARVMEYAMNGSSWAITDYAPLTAKLDYYCRCIRDGFDTTGWPEVTTWEEPLN